MRKIVVPLLCMSLVSGVVAAGFGSVTVDSDLQTDGNNATGKVGLLNTGEKTLNVSITQTGGMPTVTMNTKSLRLEPSTVTRTPSGEGWIHLGDSTYAKPRIVPLTFVLNTSHGKRDQTAAVRVTAQTNEIDRNGIHQNVLQSQKHQFTVTSTKERDADENENDDPYIGVVNASEQTTEAINETNNTITIIPGAQKHKSSPDQSSATRNDGVTTWLVTSIVITTLYIIYELL